MVTSVSRKEYKDMRSHPAIMDCLLKRTPVDIILNDEIGDLLWSVAPISDNSLWLMSFPTLIGAQYFCDEFKLPIRHTIHDTRVLHAWYERNCDVEEFDDLVDYTYGKSLFY